MIHMNSSETKYFSIKDVASLIGKSESSVKRVISKVKKGEPKKHKNPKYFNFETLPTKHIKTYVSQAFIDEYFNGATNDSTNHSTNHSANGSDELLKQTIDMLQKELDQKNKQIETLLTNQTEYLERQRESNHLLHGKIQPLELEAEPTKKRWWQRKK